MASSLYDRLVHWKYVTAAVFFLMGTWDTHATSLNFIKRGFQNCTGTCDKPEKVCGDQKLFKWCKENCGHKTDKHGPAMIIDENMCPKKQADQGENPKTASKTLSLKENEPKIFEKSRELLTEAKSRLEKIEKGSTLNVLKWRLPENQKKINALTRLIQEFELFINKSGRKLEKDREKWPTMSNSEKQKYEEELRSYSNSIGTFSDKIFDFSDWIQNKTPVNGFRSLRENTKKEEADKIFEHILKENSSTQRTGTLK